MSCHYSAGQYNDPCNWQLGGICQPGTSACTRRCTRFIAGNNGHLYPHIPRNACTSPWGDYRTSSWECKTVKSPCQWGSINTCQMSNCRRPHFIADDRGRLFPRYRKAPSTELPKLKTEKPKIEWKDIPRFYKSMDTCGTSINDDVQSQLDCLAECCLPIIWIYGLPQVHIAPTREAFAKELALRLDFTYIDMEEQLERWLGMTANLKVKMGPQRRTCKQIKSLGYSSSSHLNYPSTTLERAIRMAVRLKGNPEETVSPVGVVEFYKFAMLHAYPTRGYVLMNFPCGSAEAELFEENIWPAASGVYFMGKNWSENKEVEPEVFYPSSFRRSMAYKETDVERSVDNNGFKSIKVFNAESVKMKQMRHIDVFVDQCIAALPRILRGEKCNVVPCCEQTIMDNPSHPYVLDAAQTKSALWEDEDEAFNLDPFENSTDPFFIVDKDYDGPPGPVNGKQVKEGSKEVRFKSKKGLEPKPIETGQDKGVEDEEEDPDEIINDNESDSDEEDPDKVAENEKLADEEDKEKRESVHKNPWQIDN